MFSGDENVPNASYPTQWALNPAAYQNIDSTQVDWASLAQQWIAMKEAVAIVGASDAKTTDNAEAGEAPMEVENPDTMNSDSQTSLDQWSGEGNNWGDNNWSQWGWGWGSDQVDPKSANSNMGIPSLMDGFVPPNDPSLMPSYSSSMVPAPTFQHGYWTAPQVDQSSSTGRTNKTSRSTDRNRDSKSRSRHRDKTAPAPPVIGPVTVPDIPTLDAAKRRQLPAWIREGLEKMEREKQRAIEREQEKKAREEAEKEKKRLEEEELERLKAEAEASGLPIMPAKSKFDSDSEGESTEPKPAPLVRRRESSEMVRAVEARPKETAQPPQPPLVRKSREEIMQEVMLAVRRSLTEILLEVTDSEIRSVSQEELARYNTAQASTINAMKARQSKALSSITSGLGLGAYESSSGSEDDDEMDDVSDYQLQEIIKLRTNAFEKVSREIEAEVRRAEQREMEEIAESSPERDRQRSSVTPPNSHSHDSVTPHKITEHRSSRDQRNNHKSVDKVDGIRKLEIIPEENSKNPSRKPDNDKKETSSSSDSDSSSSSSSSSDSESDRESKTSRSAKRRKRKSSSETESRKRYKEKPREIVEEKPRSKSSRYDDYERESSRTKRRDDYDRASSRSKKKDDYYERSHKSSRDYERSHKDKYREDSGDEKRRKRSRHSRSATYESRRRDTRSRDRDRSEERYRRRDDKYDRYERSREERRRTRSRSRHRR